MAEVKKDISMMRGIIPSLHTPFNEKNKIDIPSLRKLIDHTIATGCSGMLVGAVAGENSSLTFDEKNILLNECVTYNKNRIPITIIIPIVKILIILPSKKLISLAKAKIG